MLKFYCHIIVSNTFLLFWRCKRFFNNSHSKYNCTLASLVKLFCLFDPHNYLWEFCGFQKDTNVLYDTRVEQRNNLTQTGFERVSHNIEWFLMHPVLWEWKMNHLSASPFFHQFWQLFVKISIWMFLFGIGLAVHLSTEEFNFRLGFRASWTPVEVIDYIENGGK